MDFFQRIVPERSQDVRAFANIDCKLPFNNIYDITETSTLAPGGSYPNPSIHVMRTPHLSSRRQSAAASKCASPKDQWVPSKNYISEQRRRKKLNSGLLELRSLVPNITKMDKASIIGDTITHLKELKRQIEELEKLEVAQMKAAAGDQSQPLDSSEQAERFSRSSCSQKSDELEPADSAVSQQSSQLHETPIVSSNPSRSKEDQALTHSIKVAVMKVEDEIFKLTITCQLHKISLFQVSRAIEAHIMDIVCSSFTAAPISCSTTAICVFIVKMNSWASMALQDVELGILKLLMSDSVDNESQ